MSKGVGPRLILLDGGRLEQARRRVFDGDEPFVKADERLLQDAEAAMGLGPFSVGDPEVVPDDEGPEGEGGEGFGRQRLSVLCSTVNTLSLAYFYSDWEDFAARAALLLRVFFLDEATRMEPNLEELPAPPDSPQSGGLVDARSLCWVVDALGLMAGTTVWGAEDRRGLDAWFKGFLDWLLDSQTGRDAAGRDDHEGTWYDVLTATLALHCGRDAVASAILNKRGPERLAAQIDAEGRQPLELERGLSLSYALMNLSGLFDLATLGRRCGMDLWGWRGEDGRSLKRAFDWLLENGLEKAWPYRQDVPLAPAQWVPLLRRGGEAFDDAAAQARLERLEGVDWRADRSNLLYPPLKWLEEGTQH